MIFQDPFTMLNPLLRCSKHIEEVLKIRVDNPITNRAEARREALARLVEVGITDPTAADRYPFQLSGGMRQRVGLAAALAGDPAVLIADEPSTALDVTTQAEILDLLKDVQQKRGMGLILITHDLRVAFSVAHRVYVLYAGSLVEVSTSAALEHEPLHPYTLGLLLSEPAADRRLDRACRDRRLCARAGRGRRQVQLRLPLRVGHGRVPRRQAHPEHARGRARDRVRPDR